MKQHRTCTRCHLPIQKTHRWKTVYHRFLFWTWATFEHRECSNPTVNPFKPSEKMKNAAKRLKGEVPLPFPESAGTIVQPTREYTEFMDYEEHA